MPASRNAIAGLDRVLRLYRGLRRKRVLQGAVLIAPMRIDGLPGYASLERGRMLQTTAFAIENGGIVHIYIFGNPDKLNHVARALGLDAGSPEPLQTK